MMKWAKREQKKNETGRFLVKFDVWSLFFLSREFFWALLSGGFFISDQTGVDRDKCVGAGDGQ